MAKRPPTFVFLKPGQFLTDHQKISLLAKALQTHFHEDFMKWEPDAREKVAAEMARRMMEFSNRCGQSHRLKELAGTIELTTPSEEECVAFDDLMKEIIRFREREPANAPSRAYRVVKKASGLTWLTLREALGLPAVEVEKYGPNVAVGDRG
jgi:hypothetical protein